MLSNSTSLKKNSVKGSSVFQPKIQQLQRHLFAILFFVCIGFSANAQITYTWAGTCDGNWKQGSGCVRWNPGGLWDAPPSTSETRLKFDNNTYTTMTNNVAAGYVIGQLFFGASATSARTIGGNSVQFFEYAGAWPRIENLSTTLHTINFPFVASSNSGNNMELVASSGNIDFGSLATINNNGRIIQIYGNNNATEGANRYIRLTGVLSGSGALNVSQNGVVKLNGLHTYTGQTLIDNGELWIETTGNTIASGSSIYVGNGGQMTNVTKLFLSATTGGIDFPRNINMNDGNASTRYLGGLNTSGTNTFSGTVTNTNSDLNLQAVSSGGTTNFTGIISGSGQVITLGSGVIQLSAANTYTGATTISAGTLKLGRINAIPSGATGVQSALTINGGTLSTGASSAGFSSGTATYPIGVLTLGANGGTIALAATTSGQRLYFANSSGATWAANTLTITGWTGSIGSSGTNGKIYIGGTTGTLTAGQLAKITFSGITGSSGAILMSDGELVPAALPTILSFSASPNTGTATTGYIGSTVTITGTNLTGATKVTIGGTDISITVTPTATTATFKATSAIGTFTITTPSGSSAASGTAYANAAGYISVADADWNTGSTWLGGAVPPASSTVTVAHAVTINGTVPNNPTSVTVNSTKSLTFGSSGALTIASGGSITNNGTANLGGAGTVSFAGAGTVTGTIAFNNLTLAGVLTNSTTMTVNGILQLNSGASVSNAPIYGASSTLIYNTTGSYGVGTEWTGNSTTAGSGVPKNVTIQNSTTVTLPTTNRGLAGALNVSSGAMTLNATSGDFYIAGNWTNAGTFTPNYRAVFFNGGADQTVTKTGGETFDYLIINKATSGNVVLANAVTINQTLTLTKGLLVLGNYNATFGASGTTYSASTSSYMAVTGTGKVIKAHTGSFDYPVGPNLTNYAPVTINNTGGTSQTYTIGVANTTFTPTTEGAKWQWSISAPGTSSSNLSFKWFTADAGTNLFASPASGITQNQNGSTWTNYASSTTLASPNVTTVNGITNFTNTIWTVTRPCVGTTAAVLSGTASICSGASTNLQVAITGGTSPYSVVYYDGTSNTTVNGYTSGSNISVSPSSTKTYSLVSVTSASGCIGTGNSGTAIVTVNTNSTAAVLSGTSSIYLGSSTNLQVAITGGSSPFSVIYNDGTSNFTVNNYTSNSTISVSPTSTKTYSLVSITSTGGCTGTGNSGTPTVTVTSLNTPTSQTATMASASSINLTWAKSGQGNNVMIVRSTDNTFTTPTPGTPYAIKNNSLGGDIVVYNSSETSFTDTELLPGTTYYYAFYSENYSYYSTAVTAWASTPPIINDYKANSGTYTGTTILINGSGFTGASSVMIGGVAASISSVSNIQISAIIGQNASGNTITVTNNSQTTTYSSFTYQGYITTSAGTSWNAGSNWLGGSIPPSSASVTINTADFQADVTATVGTLIINAIANLKLATGTNITVSSNDGLTLGSNNSTSTIDLNGQTMTLSGGGNLSLNGGNRYITSTIAGGILKITGTETGTNTRKITVFNGGSLSLDANTTLLLENAGFDCGSGTSSPLTTINGTLQINALGFITGNTPIYGTGSLLKYNSGGTYDRNFEWNGTTAPIGVPYNVQVSNNTTLNYVNVNNQAPQFITNNLTIDLDSSLQMNYDDKTCGGPLSIGNNFASAGTITLGYLAGDDLIIGGSFANTGTFNCNNRLVKFNSKTTGEKISGNITGVINRMDYLTFDGVGGGWLIDNDLEVSSAFAVANGNVVVNTLLTVKVEGTVTVTATKGTLTFEDKSSLLQTELFKGTNVGAITYKRTTLPVRNTDYTYWSSPVAEYTLGGVSPNTNPDKFYSFNAAATPSDWKQESSATTMVAGVGYIIRGPEDNATALAYNASFVGVPNNGDITTPIISIEDPLGTSNLIGNPYPSAIDANAFLDANSTIIDGTIYFWTHNTAIQLAADITNETEGTGAYAYTSDDYASYNRLGGVGTSPALNLPIGAVNTNIPSGKIAAGQGFFTTSFLKTANTTKTAKFTNAMRVAGTTGNNSQFFKLNNTKGKTVSSIEKDRIWLNLTNTQGAFKQTLVGYVTDATNDYDSRFDGVSFDGNEFVDFYSVNQDKNLVIQGRALPFDENDVVQLGFWTSIEGTFAINIEQVDGLLTNQAVFIEDKLTNTIFDLKSGSYTFTTTTGIFNDRFVLRYTNTTLGVNTVLQKSNDVLISTSKNQLKVNSTSMEISTVTVYDITGKKLLSKSNINNKEITLDKLTKQNQVLLVKVKLSNNQESTQKVIF